MAPGRWLLLGALLLQPLSASVLHRESGAGATGTHGASVETEPLPPHQARADYSVPKDARSVARRGAKEKLIIDTDPGVDDVLAMLLALSASTQDVELALLSVTYGNVELEKCMKNVIALFKVLGLEREWRQKNQKTKGWKNIFRYLPFKKQKTGDAFKILDTPDDLKPVVAQGPSHGLGGPTLKADYFHGVDGLHGVHGALPNMSPADSWQALFEGADANGKDESYHKFFKASKEPAHKEILRILDESPKDTVTICAIGPMTNLAMAAAENPKVFLKVKEVVVMGGGLKKKHRGNVTPFAEFNAYADPIAMARVLALTSPKPSSTMPEEKTSLADYPSSLPRKLNLALAPLDLTVPHELQRKYFDKMIKKPLAQGSPLAKWLNYIMDKVFNQVQGLFPKLKDPGLSLHDPVTVWYALTRGAKGWEKQERDIRVETANGKTLGMFLVDDRARSKSDQEDATDTHHWLKLNEGNEVKQITKSPGAKRFNKFLMTSLFP